MPVYQYRARDAQGQLVTEVLAYEDELSLRRYLRENDLFVLGISEVSARCSATHSNGASACKT